MTRALVIGLLAWALLAASPASADPALTAKLDAYFASNAFSGAVIVTQKGSVVYDKAFGMADDARHLPNLTTTSFHIGTLSRLYIAAAVMIRVEKQRLWLTNTMAQFDPSVPDGDKITIGDLLTRGDAASYDLLARILEINSGKTLDDVLDTDFFGPWFMTGTGLDDGSQAGQRRMAKGYATGAGGALTPTEPPSLGSAFTTTHDELRWSEALFDNRVVSAASLQAMSGGGLIQSAQPLLGSPADVVEGQGLGFSAAVVHQQAQGVTVVVLCNRESPPGETSKLALWLAALAVGGGDPPAASIR